MNKPCALPIDTKVYCYFTEGHEGPCGHSSPNVVSEIHEREWIDLQSRLASAEAVRRAAAVEMRERAVKLIDKCKELSRGKSKESKSLSRGERDIYRKVADDFWYALNIPEPSADALELDRAKVRLGEHKTTCLDGGDGAYPRCHYVRIIATKEREFHGCARYADLERQLAAQVEKGGEHGT